MTIHLKNELDERQPISPLQGQIVSSRQIHVFCGRSFDACAAPPCPNPPNSSPGSPESPATAGSRRPTSALQHESGGPPLSPIWKPLGAATLSTCRVTEKCFQVSRSPSQRRIRPPLHTHTHTSPRLRFPLHGLQQIQMVPFRHTHFRNEAPPRLCTRDCDPQVVLHGGASRGVSA